MQREPAAVTATELSILEVLWERGPTTVREVVQAVYQEHRQSLHAAVKSLLQRLIDKGYVMCERKGFAHLFSATVGRDAFVGQELQRLADSHYRGELTPMLLALVEKVRLSKKDRTTIVRIIETIRE
jgi:BlaI family penicillinase repressor